MKIVTSYVMNRVNVLAVGMEIWRLKMIIDLISRKKVESDWWTWIETHPVQMLPGGATICQPHWSQKDRKWFNDYWKANMGCAFFKELPDGRLVSWDYGEDDD